MFVDVYICMYIFLNTYTHTHSRTGSHKISIGLLTTISALDSSRSLMHELLKAHYSSLETTPFTTTVHFRRCLWERRGRNWQKSAEASPAAELGDVPKCMGLDIPLRNPK